MVVTRSQAGDEPVPEHELAEMQMEDTSSPTETHETRTRPEEESVAGEGQQPRRDGGPRRAWDQPSTSRLVSGHIDALRRHPPQSRTTLESRDRRALESRGERPPPRYEEPTAHAEVIAQKIREAELAAEEQLMALRLKYKEELIRKRLEYSVASIREEGTEMPPPTVDGAPVADTPELHKVQEWLREQEQSKQPQPEVDAQRVDTQEELKPRETRTAVHQPVRMKPVRRVEWDHPKILPTVLPQGTTRSDGNNLASPPRATDGMRSDMDHLITSLNRVVNRRPPLRELTELPKFSGVASEWCGFKVAMIHSTEQFQFTPVENIARLRNCLQGKAREAVSSLLNARNPDPERIMRALDRTFGRPEVIAKQAMASIQKLKKPETPVELDDFAIALQNIISSLKEAEGQRDHLMNPQLVKEVLSKLPPAVKEKWVDYAYEYCNFNEPEIVILSQFIEMEADRKILFLEPDDRLRGITAEKCEKTRNPYSGARGRPGRGETYATVATAQAVRQKPSCIHCGGEHQLSKCSKYLNLDIGTRWEVAKGARVCFKCLEIKHRRTNCKAKSCGVKGCNRPHHAILHRDKFENGGATAEAVMNTVPGHARDRVLLKICPVTIRGPQGEVETYALLDEGSTVTLVEEKLAAAVGADGPTESLRIRGVNSIVDAKCSKAVSLQIRGRSMSQFVTITARTVQGLKLHRQTVSARLMEYAHLKNLKKKDVCYEGVEPWILIGADHWHLIVSREVVSGPRRAPAAVRTDLGWMIMGTIPRSILDEQDACVHHLHLSHETAGDSDGHLQELVKQHFQIDALGVSLAVKVKPEDERAVRMFEATARRIESHFEVGLPWRSDEPKMPPSFENAFRRLKTMERKMDRDPAFREMYTNQIKNLLEKKYAEACSEEDEKSEKAWYLPHFAVTNPNKPGKLRLVFDAAAKYNGTSLNENLLEGPDLLQSLPGILFRFREGQVAVTADIQEMFLQVKIRKEDQPSQMFLWRGGDRDHAPKRYKMTSMIFGATSSPFLAHSVRNRNARDWEKSHPAAFTAITQSHYMDDFVDSFATMEEAKKAVQEVDFVHKQASFLLRGWNSNKKCVVSHIPKELHSSDRTQLLAGMCPEEKTLGLIWDAQKDELGFNTTMPRVKKEVRYRERAPTKRETLSAVMSVYDPLGLLSPYTIVAKIMLQSLWRINIGWDEPIPEEQARSFFEWMQGLDHIKRLRLPRCYDERENNSERELHVFCDASELAYAAVAYWRIRRSDGTVIVRLAAAKSKVAPLKSVSIPRMELQAAIIGSRLAEAVRKEHRWETRSTTFWSDSRTVLIWIRTNARKYTAFVAHRLGEIAERTNIGQWRWVPTKLNPADDATRSCFVAGPRAEWLDGPEFLRCPENEWPQEPAHERGEPVEEVLVHHTTRETPPHWAAMPDINRISKWNVLIRATARVLYIASKWLHKSTRLEVHHVKLAEKLWLERAQEDSFADDINKLKRGEMIPRSSRLYKLDPVYGTDRLLRVRGRIGAAPVPDGQKRPIILDGRHRLARMLIQKEHEAAGHAGHERVVNDLRQRFWILHLRPSVRAVARECQYCQIRKATPKVPTFGDLPAERLAPFSRPFQNTGVDYFGPIIVTVGRRHEKRWCALFTCLTTRAIHLEMVSSLATDSAIQALRRMGARRGWPSVIYSDNATNFRGADVELRAAYKEWAEPMREFCLNKVISWKFIPPGAPNQGGAWERLVRSVKNALSATLEQKYPKEETLHTLLVEAEHSINARPLTHVSVSHEDPEALTPNHFLIGSSSGLPVMGPCHPADRRTWRAAQALADEFWRRWVREYLPNLVPRGSATQGSRQLKPGDLVIVVDGNLPRNVWPRGVVERVYPGPDGEVRCADVRTQGGILKRPTRKLAVLPVTKGFGSQEPGSLCRGEDVTDSRQ